MYGVRGEHYFSEDFQAEFIKKYWQILQKEKDIIGAIIWSFIDYRYPCGRRIFNGYIGTWGIYDLERRPKKAAAVVKKLFHSQGNF